LNGQPRAASFNRVDDRFDNQDVAAPPSASAAPTWTIIFYR
jgi:hypothetical protein